MCKRVMCAVCYGSGWVYTPKEDKVRSYRLGEQVPKKDLEIEEVKCPNCHGRRYVWEEETDV